MNEIVFENGVEYEIQYEILPNSCGPCVKFPISKKEIKRFDLYKFMFPYDPIYIWSEKKCKEIEEKYKWLDEVEFVSETDSNFVSNFVSKQNPASFVDSPKMKLKKGW